MRILVAGFGAFPGAPRNPTEGMAARIAKRARSFSILSASDLTTAVLPVDWRMSARVLRDLLRARPDIVLMLGVAGRRRCISIETRARNFRSILRPDMSKRWAAGRKIQDYGEPIRRARFPFTPFATALSKPGMRVRLSADAGDYLCNSSLYSALDGEAAIVGFVHFPFLSDPYAPINRRRGDRRRTPASPL